MVLGVPSVIPDEPPALARLALLLGARMGAVDVLLGGDQVCGSEDELEPEAGVVPDGVPVGVLGELVDLPLHRFGVVRGDVHESDAALLVEDAEVLLQGDVVRGSLLVLFLVVQTAALPVLHDESLPVT